MIASDRVVVVGCVAISESIEINMDLLKYAQFNPFDGYAHRHDIDSDRLFQHRICDSTEYRYANSNDTINSVKPENHRFSSPDILLKKVRTRKYGLIYAEDAQFQSE